MGLRSQTGQTVVEYILLLAVSVSLIWTFYNSQAFQRLFGTQGSLGTIIKAQTEFSYRHAFATAGTPDIDRDNRDGASHPSYKDGAGSRFFGARDPYP